MTRSQKEKIRYRTIRNYTGDVKLAKRLRGWSDSKILNEYGIIIPSKEPKIKTYSPKTYYKRQLEIKKYQLAKARGSTTKQALNLKKVSYDKLRDNTRLYTPRTHADISNERMNRRQEWSRWSKKDSELPEEYIDIAIMINRLNGLDDHAKYGYAVAFYSYTENGSLDQDVLDFWMEQLQPDKWDGDRYREVRTAQRGGRYG